MFAAHKIKKISLIVFLSILFLSSNVDFVNADYTFNTRGITQDISSDIIPESSVIATDQTYQDSTSREKPLYRTTHGAEGRVPRNTDILFTKESRNGNTVLVPVRTVAGGEIKRVSRQGSNLEEVFEYAAQEIGADGEPTGSWLETSFHGRGIAVLNNGNKLTLDGNNVTAVVRPNGEVLGVNRDGESFGDLLITSTKDLGKSISERFVIPIECGINAMCYVANASHHLFMTPAARMLGLSGRLFDFVLSGTVLQMNQNFFGGRNDDESAINIGWKIFRDLSNIIFIFVLLYISINTILHGVGNSGRDIVTVIVIAVLINFSMFFTKVFIDFSNLIALNFYNQITEVAAGPNGEVLYPQADNSNEVSLAGAFIAQTKLTTLYNKADNNRDRITSVADHVYIIQQSIGGGFLMIFLAIILFIAALMLITRFIILAFVLMMSSIAFGSYVLPQLKSKVFDKWSGALIGQSLVAPVFIFFVYLSLIFITKMPSSNSTSDLSDVVLVTAQGIMPYIMSIGFLIFSLIAAKQMGDKAGKASGSITKGIGGMAIGGAAKVGRVAGGGTARFLSNNLEGNSAASIAIKNRLDRAASSSWDMRNSSAIKKTGKASGLGDMLGKGGGKGGYDAIVKKADERRENNYKQAGKKTGRELRREDKKNRMMEQRPELSDLEGYRTLLKAKAEKDTLDARLKEVTRNPLAMTERDTEEAKAIKVKLDGADARIKTITNKISPEDMEKLSQMSTKQVNEAQKIIEKGNNAGNASKTRSSNYVAKSTAGKIETTDRRGKTSTRLNIPFTPSHSRFAQKTRAEAAKKAKQTDYEKLLDGLTEAKEKQEKSKEKETKEKTEE